MARVPQVPQQTVGVKTPAPVQAPPGAFGPTSAVLGMVGKEAGAQAEGFERHALEMAALDNKINSDAAALATAQAHDNKQLEFQKNFQGEKAEPAVPQMYKDLEAIRVEGGKGLLSPAARDMYNAQTRIATAQAMSNVSRFAASEGLRARNDKIDATAKNIVRSMTVDNYKEMAKLVGEQGALKAGVNGLSTEAATNWINEQLGTAAYSLTVSLARDKPELAEAFMKENGGVMDPGQRVQAENVITASKENFMVSAAADAAVAAAMGAPSGSEQEFLVGTDGREGSGKNPYSSAEGRGQFTGKIEKGKATGTWFEVMKLPEFAAVTAGKTPAEILELRKNPTIARQAILAHRRENLVILKKENLPQTNAAAAVLHAFGVKGGVDVLKSPGTTLIDNVIGADVARINRISGQTTQRVVADIAKRFPRTVASSGDRYDALTTNAGQAMERVAQLPQFAGRPDLVARTQQLVQGKSNDIIWAQNLGAKAASDFIIGAAQANNITDPVKLQQIPGVLEALQHLSEKQKISVINSVSGEGNRWTEDKQRKYEYVMGLQLNGREQDFLRFDATSEPGLTNDQKKSIFNAQLAMKKKNEGKASTMKDFVTQNVKLITSDTRIGIATRDMSDEDYTVFLGALNGALEQWGSDPKNAGKKISLKEGTSLAYDLLAKRKAYTANPGMFDAKTYERPNYEVPEYWLKGIPTGQNKTRLELITEILGHAPKPDEIALAYHREH